MEKLLAIGLPVTLLVASWSPLRACDTPVFRWALERWGANHPEECYGATIFHKGPLEGAAKTAVEWLKERTWPEANTNLLVRTLDVAEEMEAPAKELWEAQEKAELPWVVLQFPVASRIPVHAWAGPLTEESAKRLLESPARARVAKRILAGDAAVWVFLESGDKEKDDAAAKLLSGHLEELEKLLEIPKPMDPMGYWEVPEPGAEEEQEPEEPEHPSFTVERVSRTDPAEALLAHFLLRTEENLEKDGAEEPVVFPVFGRGRALWALVGKGINKMNIEEASVYIVGRCSCEFKWMNPGTDLLMAADWDTVPATPTMQPPELLTLVAPPDPASEAEDDTAGTEEEAAVKPEAEPAQAEKPEETIPAPEKPAAAVVKSPTRSASPADADSDSSSRLLRNLAIALGALIVIIGVSALQLRRKLGQR
jgi:hypothetical protein